MLKNKWKMSVSVFIVFIVGLSLVMLSCAAPSTPTEKAEKTPKKQFTLVHETVYPKHHRTAVQDEWWHDKVEKASNGRIKFEYHTGGEPVPKKEALKGLSEGQIDVLTAASVYYSGKVAIADPLLMPKNFKTWDDLFSLGYGKVGKIWDKVYRKEANVKLLWLNPFAGENFQVAKKTPKIRHFEDFKGLKCRAAGAAGSRTVKNMGMSPVTTIGGEYYTAMQRGTVDIGLMTTYSLETYKIWEVCDQVVNPPVFNHCAVLVWMNLDTWNSLPEDLQDILINTARAKEFQKRQIDYIKKEDKRIKEEAKEKGVEFYTLPPEDQKQMWEAVSPVWDWYVNHNKKMGYGAEAKKVREIMSQAFKQ